MSSQASLSKGHEAMRQGRFPEAVAAFDAALQQDSSNVDALYMKAQALSFMGQERKAVAVYDRLLGSLREGSDPWAETLVSKADTLIELEELDDAERCLTDALRVLPQLSTIWVHRARVAARRKDYEESVAHCDRALKLDDRDARAWNNKAFALLQLDRLDECIECAKRALDLDPGYHMAQMWLSQAYERKATGGAGPIRVGDAIRVRETRGHKPVAKRRSKWWRRKR